MSFVGELKRRNVIRVGAAYVVAAWAFELTRDDLKKEKDVDHSQPISAVTGRRLDFVIIGMLTLALGYSASAAIALMLTRAHDLLYRDPC